MRKAQKISLYADIYKKAATIKGSALPASFWVGFVQMAKRLDVDPYNLAAVINSESGFNPGAQNIQEGRIIAQGLNQLIHAIATKTLGMSEELWQNFSQLPPEEHLKWTEKFFRKFGDKLKGKSAGDIYLMNFGGFNNPDGSLYASKEAQERFIQANPGAEFKNSGYQQKAIEQNPGIVDQSGRIMPEQVRSLVASGPPNDIKIKIDEALRTTQGQSVPPFVDPNPNWTGTQLPTSLNQPQYQPQQIQNITPVPEELDFGSIENTLWFQ